MARKRLIAPQFFTHELLFDAEQATRLPLRVAFAGMWGQCDRRGVFEWRPRRLKPGVLPFDALDFADVLNALERYGFVYRYAAANGDPLGWLPSLPRWQTFHHRENESAHEGPPLALQRFVFERAGEWPIGVSDARPEAEPTASPRLSPRLAVGAGESSGDAVQRDAAAVQSHHGGTQRDAMVTVGQPRAEPRAEPRASPTVTVTVTDTVTDTATATTRAHERDVPPAVRASDIALDAPAPSPRDALARQLVQGLNAGLSDRFGALFMFPFPWSHPGALQLRDLCETHAIPGDWASAALYVLGRDFAKGVPRARPPKSPWYFNEPLLQQWHVAQSADDMRAHVSSGEPVASGVVDGIAIATAIRYAEQGDAAWQQFCREHHIAFAEPTR